MVPRFTKRLMFLLACTAPKRFSMPISSIAAVWSVADDRDAETFGSGELGMMGTGHPSGSKRNRGAVSHAPNAHSQ
jgi:hypothetical protein